MASIRAAEELKAPAIIEIFPWSIKFQGPEYVKFAANACHSAKVPIALHLDHCTEPDDVYTALELPFDSIMVDASSQDPEENVKFVKSIVDLAATKGITIEAEMGRIVGGEDGLPVVDMEALYTEPKDAVDFVKRTGVHFLAPSIGNVHGPYPPGGPEKYWQLDRLEAINNQLPEGVPLVLHGAYPVIDSLIKKTVDLGVRKVNLNGNLHDDYSAYIAANSGKVGMTTLQEESLKLFCAEAKRSIQLLGSDGKAQ